MGHAADRDARPTVDEVLDDFLADQRGRLTERTLRKYESVISYLRHHLNGYGHEGLSSEERALFERCYNAEGEEHREFCQLFGPEKIIDNLGTFLGYFMIRKVLAGEELKKAAGTVTKKLSKWLGAEGYISLEEGRYAVEESAGAARDLPRAERAARILFEVASRLAVDLDGLLDDDYLDFDHHRIARLEPGKLWLEVYGTRGAETLGPIAVPGSATSLLEEGWELSCALARLRGRWLIVEKGNVYP